VVLDYEPSIQLHETDDAIIGQIYFPLARFSVELMQEFSRFFMALVQVVVVEAGRNISEIAPSGVRGT
jgi:hypothetical protein